MDDELNISDEFAQQPAPRGERKEGFKARTLRALFEALMRIQGSEPGRVRFIAMGQSHLDAAWRWRVFQTRSKAKVTFRNALRNIGAFPEFTFSQSSPAYYQWMKDRQPRIFRAIQNAAKRGQWEITGGSWVEPDCNLADGESLVRQRLYGQRFYLEHFGRVAEIEWLPDTFGFCWTLPQIMAKSGAKYFWTTKLLWNDTNRFPFRTFLWRSPDGTEILTHVCPFFGFNPGDMFRGVGANRVLPEGASLTADYTMNPRDIVKKLEREPMADGMIAYGLGDGGGGPTELEIDIFRTLKQAGTVEFGTAADFYARLEDYRGRLPVWNDELYLEYHRGCYTTQSRVKRYNRRVESLLRNAEIIHSMNSLFGNPYPEEELREAWKTLCFHQFHDILPGSSIPEVYEDAYEEYERVERQGEELITGGLSGIARRINTGNPDLADCMPLVVYNTLSWRRNGLVRIEVVPTRTFKIFDPTGAPVPGQNLELGNRHFVFFNAPDLPDLGYRTYYLKEELLPREPLPPAPDAWNQPGEPATATRLDDGSVVLENEFLKVRVDAESGWITSIIDKINQRETLDGPANSLRLFRDNNTMYPAWNIEPSYKKQEIPIAARPESIEITDRGPVAATVTVRRAVHNSPVAMQVRLFAGRPLVDVAAVIDWREKKAILKAYCHAAIKTGRVTCEIPYGAIERAAGDKNKFDRGRWEQSCQKWVSVSDGRYGLAILNEGKYGFDADGGTIGVTLLRGPRYPSAIVNAWGLGEPLNERPTHTDQGLHVIRWGVMPHAGDWRAARLWRAGLEFNNPPLAVRTSHHQGIKLHEGSSLRCEAATTYVSAVKRPEDNPGRHDARYHQLVVRLVEAAGAHDTVRLNFSGGDLVIDDVKEMDLLEFNTSHAGEVKEGAIALEMKPFEIKTIKVTLAVKTGGE